jgi:hypothetical protein
MLHCEGTLALSSDIAFGLQCPMIETRWWNYQLEDDVSHKLLQL